MRATTEVKERAIQEVKSLIAEGWSKSRAAKKVAGDHSLNWKSLTNWVNGAGKAPEPLPEIQEDPDKIEVKQIRKPAFQARISAEQIIRKVLGRNPTSVNLNSQDGTKITHIMAEWEED